MYCSAQSPDLNPIENAWAIRKRRLRERARSSKNADELVLILQQDWASIPDSCLKQLISSLHTRVQLVKLNKGRSSKDKSSTKLLQISRNVALSNVTDHTKPRTPRKYSRIFGDYL